jgi:hypothetical protein
VVDELSRFGDLDRDERWDLLLFFECLRTDHTFIYINILFSYFFDDFPSRLCLSRLADRRERFLSRSLFDRCDAERCAGDPSVDDDELDVRFLNKINKISHFVFKTTTRR